MPNLEELSDALAASIGGADTETAATVILGHFKIVRAEALREAADRCDALHPAALAVHCATAIRALIDAPTSSSTEMPVPVALRRMDKPASINADTIRWNALEHAREVATEAAPLPVGSPSATSYWKEGAYAQRRFMIERLIALQNEVRVPPSAPPADVTRALARAFRMYAKGYRLTAMLVDNGLLENETLDEAGHPKLTILGRTVLSLAEGK